MPSYPSLPYVRGTNGAIPQLVGFLDQHQQQQGMPKLLKHIAPAQISQGLQLAWNGPVCLA